MKKLFCSIAALLSFLYYLWLGGFRLPVLPFWQLLSILFLWIGFWRELPFSDRIPKILCKLANTVLAIALVFFLLTECFVLWGMTLHAPEHLDYLLVLGAGLNGDRPSYTLELRLENALSYLNTHPGTKIVVSGGRGSAEALSEAQSMYNWLIEKGVDSSLILMEDRSTTTAENMQFSFPIIKEDASDPDLRIGIVTSNFHIFRSLCLASHAVKPLEASGFTCHLYGIPSAFPPYGLPHYMVREFFTICVDTGLGNMDFPLP